MLDYEYFLNDSVYGVYILQIGIINIFFYIKSKSFNSFRFDDRLFDVGDGEELLKFTTKFKIQFRSII